MIEIIPFNKQLFNDFNIDNKKITKYTYINNIELISKLLIIKLPINNKKLAIRNILDFLSYLDNKIEETKNTIIPISSDIFIKYFNRDCYKKYIDLLSNLDILTRVPYDDGTFYTTKSLYCQYRVHNNYINEEDLAIIVLEDSRTKNEFINDIPEIDNRYINTIKKLEIDIPNAIKSEIEYFHKENLAMSTFRSRISRIFYTKRKRFIKKGLKVDRIYHSFTNVSRISRKHLNIKMFDIDIKNCQPLLLIAFLKINNMKFDDNYKLDCESGSIYENFIGINNLDRNKTKVQIYKNIFFAFNERSKFNKKFKELYPNTWNSLNEINLSNKSLATGLQNLESELFNNLIPNKSKYYFTLFDAIYFDAIDDISLLVNKINDFFNKLEIKVSIEIGI